MCLAFLLDGVEGGHGRVLLGLKRRGFGSGNIAGIGGHLEPGETSRQAAVRETWEESGFTVDPGDLREAGHVAFRFSTHPAWDMGVDLFTARRWTGTLTASPELDPQWFDVAAIPWDRMWDDSRIWLPYVLRGEVVRADVTYNDAGDEVAHLTLDVSPPT